MTSGEVVGRYGVVVGGDEVVEGVNVVVWFPYGAVTEEDEEEDGPPVGVYPPLPVGV